MGGGLFLALAGAAVSIGSLHSLAPDHWVPFAAIARAQHWPARKTAFVTFFCGFGHVTVSALLGVLALLFGQSMFASVGETMESVARLRRPFLDRWGDAVAHGVIVLTGVVVGLLGI
jgi:high-affinity nickel permease